jgi:hypothetical protein
MAKVTAMADDNDNDEDNDDDDDEYGYDSGLAPMAEEHNEK